MNPQFFKLYQGDHENTAWWDLRHCVIFSGGIFFFFLAVLEWEVSAFLLSVHSCIPDMCQGLCCCHTSRLALGQHRVQFIFRVASEGEEMCSAWGCAIGAMGDGPACQGSGSRILLLDVSSSPHGSLASV